MARLSDVIRNGETALEQGSQPAASAPAEQQNGGEEGDGAQFPATQPQPPPNKMQDFPILTQIHNEVGIVATVVDKIDQISEFINAFKTGEQAPLRSPSAAQAAPAAAPGATPPPQPGASPARHREEVSPAQPGAAVQPPAVTKAEPASEEEVDAVYNQLFDFVQGVMKAAQAGEPFAIDQSFVTISRTVDMPQATDILYRKAIYTRESEDQHAFESAVVLHSVNVAIYSIKIGEGLGYNRDQLIDLGVAALTHDVGMVTLPADIFSKGKLTDADKQALNEHPLKGHEILSQLGDSFDWVSDVALQEHEREDGSGYPNGLKGNGIHQYAKIVGMADMYVGLTRSRPERRGLLPFEAVKEILQTHKAKFDPRVIRVLLGKLSAFPVGSLVQLNSGAVGTVIETDEVPSSSDHSPSLRCPKTPN
jgi:HD-GYP domain-containing protein (c-di-GMP phosphodiesterase class II)